MQEHSKDSNECFCNCASVGGKTVRAALKEKKSINTEVAHGSSRVPSTLLESPQPDKHLITGKLVSELDR